MRHLFHILIMNLLLALSLSVQAETEIFKWYDEQGRVHYSERPEGDNARKLDLRSHRFREIEKKENKNAEKVSEERKKMCDDAQDTLAKYKSAPFLYRYDVALKQKVRLTEKETQDAFLQADKDIKYWCAETKAGENN